jgi:anaerobic ribonucleoside-triphosphate reductase activating protein
MSQNDSKMRGTNNSGINTNEDSVIAGSTRNLVQNNEQCHSRNTCHSREGGNLALNNEIIYIAGIVNDSIVDGPGLRLTIFTQGCDKRCEGCHNPQAQPLSGGTPYSIEQIIVKIKSNPILSGVTLSGGEPLLQAQALLPLAKQISELGLDLAMYTGDTFEQILVRGDEDQLALVGLCSVLIDGPFVLAEKSLTLAFRGSANQRILDAKRSLELGAAILSEDENWQLR